MKSVCVRVEDAMHQQIQRKIISQGLTMQQYVTTLLELDMANDLLPKHLNADLLDDATVIEWLKQRLGCLQGV